MRKILSKAVWWSLTPAHRELVEAGVPVDTLGCEIRDIEFEQYLRGTELRQKMITAITQQRTLIEYINDIKPAASDDPSITSGVWLINSGLGHAALGVAVAILARHQAMGYTVRASSAAALNVGSCPAHVHIIYGIDPDMTADARWRIRNYVRAHSGSLILLVTSVGDTQELGRFAYDQLRTRIDYVFCCVDSEELIKITTAGGR